MKFNVVLNACSNTIEIQAKEIQALLSKFKNKIQMGYTIYICNNNSDINKLKKISPTCNIIILKVEYYQPEIVLKKLTKIIEKDAVYCFGSDYSGHELAARTSKRVSGSCVIGVSKAELTDKGLEATKKVYSNHMYGRFLMKKTPYCISMAKGSEQEEINDIPHKVISEIDVTSDSDFVISRNIQKEEESNSIENANFIVVAGRGVGHKNAVEKLSRIAESLNGQIGVTRPAAMSAWAPMNCLIGVSGAITKPEICITAGVSGAEAFYTGIEKSDFIVSINNYENAPIINKSDVAIIDDYESVMDRLSKCILLDRKEHLKVE